MKKILQTAAIVGVLLPLSAQAQVTVNRPSSYASIVYPAIPFDTLVTGMAVDAGDLKSPVPYTEMAFNVVTMDWTTNFGGGALPVGSDYIYFREVSPNWNFFQIVDFAQAGYIGNDSRDTNQLNVLSYDETTPGFNWGDESTWAAAQTDADTLFDYTIGGVAPTMGPPDSVEIVVDAGGKQVISFQHIDYSWPKPGDTIAQQGDEEKFKIFWAYDSQGNALDAALFAIDDRMLDLIDYNDGLFYVEGITPVPEPAAIAGLAVLGLGGILYVRRRVKAKAAK